MSINDVDKLSASRIENVKRKTNNEISRLEGNHVRHKEQIKKSHELELVDLQHKNLNQLAKESEKKDRVLNQMKHHLDVTQKLTDKEIGDLKQNVEQTKGTEYQKLSLEREQRRADHDLHMEDMNSRFTNDHKEMMSHHQQRLTKLNSNKTEEFADKEHFYDQKLNHQTQDFSDKFRKDSLKYEQLKFSQDNQFKKERLDTNYRQQVEMDKMTTKHDQDLSVKDKNYRRGLKEQNEFYEKKFADNLKTRNEELSRLEGLNKKVESKIKGDLQEKIEYQVNRSDDPFYRFTELKPTLKKFEDHVIISVPVPEYSKSDVHLTINNKDAVLNFNRRYDDVRQDGSTTNKLHKVESYTTRLSTDFFLDAKSIKSSYKDGVMTYEIKRA
jgi:HSP20 family molecular chaperone IbpA